MKNIKPAICLLLASCFFLSAAQAHAPSEHKAKMEKPKCEAMKNMDPSKLDPNDPIMMAMKKKCMKEEPAKGAHKSTKASKEKKHTDQRDH
jgi:hypothetical protein